MEFYEKTKKSDKPFEDPEFRADDYSLYWPFNTGNGKDGKVLSREAKQYKKSALKWGKPF